MASPISGGGPSLRGAAPWADEDYPLAAKVAHLRRPESYNPRASRVEAVETHMSWVFLTDWHAWKLKKPVHRAFLDFSTVDARRANCEAELRLNRRLAPEVYLAVVPLAVSAEGALVLGGPGRPVDWLVQMQRLPRERMLDAAIASGAASEAELAAVVRVLAAFYRRASAVPISPREYLQRLRADIDACGHELAARQGAWSRSGPSAVAATLGRFVDEHEALLSARVAEGRVVEGHGDLRPEHICLVEPPAIIDCLEFNDGFRVLDVADELAFLALECERLGAAALGARLFADCTGALGDRVPAMLFDFYAAGRALLRAKLAAWHLADVPPAQHGQWSARAHEYLALAARHAAAATEGCAPSA